MIEWIEGKIYKKEPTKLIIEIGSVAILFNIPISTYESIGNIGEKVKIFTYVHMQQEEIKLFGFHTQKEREFFFDLLSVSKIGPQIALRILSNIEFEKFKYIVVNEDVNFLSSIKGIGEKTAKKIIFELKEKYSKEEIKSIEYEAILALTNLGISYSEARKLVDKIKAESVEEIVKEALKRYK